MKIYLIALAGALALGTTGASAQQALTRGDLAAMDTDGDGAVSPAEMDAIIAKAFAALDANGDGYLTITESSTVITPEQFKAANANGDDGLSLQEMQAAAAADMKTADRDGNGKLD